MATLADIQRLLKTLKLDFLADIVSKAATEPTLDVSNIDQLGTFLETYPDPNVQAAYKQRFSGNALREQRGFLPLKPSDYIQRENEFIDRLRQNGLPLGFYDQPADLAKLVGGGTSAVEFDNRIRQGYQAALNADPETKNALRELYGVSDADLAAYYLDPDRATDILGRRKNAQLFAQQISAAQVAGQAQAQAGLGLTVQQAETLVSQGVTSAEARRGFTSIQEQQGLYAAQMAGEQAVSQEEQIAAAFGTSAAAKQRVETRRRRRQAEFEAGGTLGVGQTGVAGLRTAGQ